MVESSRIGPTSKFLESGALTLLIRLERPGAIVEQLNREISEAPQVTVFKTVLLASLKLSETIFAAPPSSLKADIFALNCSEILSTFF